ncbi:hypothetical protein AAE478_003939 [Parahypoxylon ruwenzoriense]
MSTSEKLKAHAATLACRRSGRQIASYKVSAGITKPRTPRGKSHEELPSLSRRLGLPYSYLGSSIFTGGIVVARGSATASSEGQRAVWWWSASEPGLNTG